MVDAILILGAAALAGRDGSVAGAPMGHRWLCYFDILGGYFGPSTDMGDEGWFMLDRLRLDEHHIGPPEGFIV